MAKAGRAEVPSRPATGSWLPADMERPLSSVIPGCFLLLVRGRRWPQGPEPGADLTALLSRRLHGWARTDAWVEEGGAGCFDDESL